MSNRFGQRFRPGVLVSDLLGEDVAMWAGPGLLLVDHDTGLPLTWTGTYTNEVGTWGYLEVTEDFDARVAAHGVGPWGAKARVLAVPAGGGNGNGGAGAGGGPAKEDEITFDVGEIIRFRPGVGGPGNATGRGTRGGSTQVGPLFADGGGEAAALVNNSPSSVAGPGSGGRLHSTTISDPSSSFSYGGQNSNGFYGGKSAPANGEGCGGGAGAGEDGGDAVTNTPGDGGDGFESDITGVSVKYGPGGGGARGGTGAGGAGGATGGGQGYGSTTAAGHGTAGTGGGAGGQRDGSSARNGGSGKGIIAVLLEAA